MSANRLNMVDFRDGNNGNSKEKEGLFQGEWGPLEWLLVVIIILFVILLIKSLSSGGDGAGSLSNLASVFG